MNDFIPDWAVMDFGNEPMEEPTSEDNYNFD